MRISDWSSDVCSSDLPFYTDKATGLGLGLSISYNIVEAHGGTLTASTPGDGKGMLFSLSLPNVRHDDGTQEQQSNGLHKHPCRSSLEKKRKVQADQAFL